MRGEQAHPPMKIIFIVLCIVLIVIGAEIWFLFTSHRVPVLYNGIVPPLAAHTVDDFKWNDEKSKWSAYMDSVGPEVSYRMLKESYGHETFMVQHTAIHLFGVLFYKKYGLKGIRFCDNSFAFGCYHSFFAAASSKEGPQMLVNLDQECDVLSERVDVFSCQHGIGHSLLAHGQMTDKELRDALELCDTLSHREPISGCKSGVFMEYNFRSMASIEKAGIMMMRSFEEKSPYAPCSSLSDTFLEACYFAQAQWWDKVLDHNYPQIGKLCASITSKKYRLSCFSGAGNVASEYANYDVDKVIMLCDEMPVKEGVTACLITASWTFSNDTRLHAKAPEICKKADKEVRTRCVPRQ